MKTMLGVYFGPQIISIMQVQGKKLLKGIKIPRSQLLMYSAEEKVPEEVKMVALLKDELRKNSIVESNVAITLSGQDLIIRTFEMPLIPKEEIATAVRFEAKKYMPFKIEELVLDYQVYTDKSVKKNYVLLVGVKQDTLNKYITIFDNLKMRVRSINYSAFNILKLCKLCGVKEKGVVALANVDFKDNDEMNFMALENGFPMFSRDISVMDESGAGQENASQEPVDRNVRLEKFVSEVRVSLDFYHRKFPAKHMDRLYFVSSDNFQQDFSQFAKELNIPVKFLDVDRLIDSAAFQSLGMYKAYGSALADTVKIGFKIDLLAAQQRSKVKKIGFTKEEEAISFLTGLKFNPLFVLLGILSCIAIFVYGAMQIMPIKKEINNIKSVRIVVPNVDGEASYDELVGVNTQLQEKYTTLDNLIRNRMYMTSTVNIVPKVVPSGIWFTAMKVTNENDIRSLELSGMVYMGDAIKELKIINDFIGRLKADAQFLKNFPFVTVSSVGQSTVESVTVTEFTIVGNNKPK